MSSTYDHRILRTRLPVRSALFKQDTGGLVVRWVTTSESPLLYVFACEADFLLYGVETKVGPIDAPPTSKQPNVPSLFALFYTLISALTLIASAYPS
jgi:hypothetical protein